MGIKKLLKRVEALKKEHMEYLVAQIIPNNNVRCSVSYRVYGHNQNTIDEGTMLKSTREAAKEYCRKKAMEHNIADVHTFILNIVAAGQKYG